MELNDRHRVISQRQTTVRLVLAASRVGIVATVGGIALWVIQLFVGLPPWLWWSKVAALVLAASGYLVSRIHVWVLAKNRRDD